MSLLTEQLQMIDQAVTVELGGSVREVRGMSARVSAMPAPVGTQLTIKAGRGRAKPVAAEVIGFDGDEAVVMPLHSLAGVGPGDQVTAGQHQRSVRVGSSLLGRVLNGMGEPIDGLGPLRDTVPRPLVPRPVDPLDRPLLAASPT